jgi:hypothetical protein
VRDLKIAEKLKGVWSKVPKPTNVENKSLIYKA